MYAIIRTGGKQYRVQPGDVIRVEKLENELGSEFNLTEVLMIGGNSPVLGTPSVSGATVTVVVTKQTKDKKVIVFKKKRRQGYRKFGTHRQQFTELFIKAIAHGGQTAKTDNEAKVVDVDKSRMERVQAKVDARKERAAAGKNGNAPIEAKAKKAPAKKAAPKKAAAKKAPAKKAGAAKAKKKTSKK